MSDKSNIENASRDDKRIILEDYNTIIDTVNKFNHTVNDPSSIDYVSEDGITKSIMSTRNVQEDFPFRAQDHGQFTISVVKGDWVRDATSIGLSATALADQDPDDADKLLIETTSFTNAGVSEPLAVDTDYYVYVQLLNNVAASTYEYDPALFPGDLNIFVDRDRATAGVRTIAEMEAAITETPSFAREQFVKDKEVVAVVQVGLSGADYYIKSIDQKINNNIDDYQIVADTLSNNTNAADSYRQTLVHNLVLDTAAAGSVHFGELEMAYVDKCAGAGTLSFPFFISSTTENTNVGPSGYLQWAALDGHYQPQGPQLPDFRTLDLTADQNTSNVPNGASGWNDPNNAFFNIHLYGSRTTDPSSKSMCYYDASTDDGFGQTKGVLRWAVIDNEESGGTQKSLEINTAPNPDLFQLYEFDTPTASQAMAADDKVLVRDDTGPELRYVDADDLWDWIDANGGGGVSPIPGVGDHTDLTDIDAGSYTDHDHGNYFQNALSSNGKYANASWDYQVNYCSSIGNASADLILDLDNEKLFKSTDAVNPQINWDAAELDDAADWSVLAGCKFFVKDTSSGSAGTGANAFEVYGGGEFGSSGNYVALLGDATNTRAAYFIDNTGNTVDICTNTYGIYIAENTKFNLGLGSSNEAAIFTDTVAGKTVRIETGTYGIDSQQAINVSTGTGYDVAGTQVVIDQQAAIADVTETGSDEDQTCRAKVNDILAMLRTHGLIAT